MFERERGTHGKVLYDKSVPARDRWQEEEGINLLISLYRLPSLRHLTSAYQGPCASADHVK